MKKIIILSVTTILLGIFFVHPCVARDTLTYKTDDIDINRITRILDLQPIEEPVKKQPFSSFDVNEQGMLLVGCEGFERDKFYVYNADGSFAYGYSFTSNGSFGVEWDGRDIIIYSSRSGFAKWVNPAGICFDVKAIEWDQKYISYRNNHIFSTTKIINDVTYTAEHWLSMDVFWRWENYYSIEKSSPDGKATILYAASPKTAIFFVTLCFVWCIGAPIFLLILLIRVIRKKNRS